MHLAYFLVFQQPIISISNFVNIIFFSEVKPVYSVKQLKKTNKPRVQSSLLAVVAHNIGTQNAILPRVLV